MLLGERGGTLGARFQYRRGQPLQALPLDAFGEDRFGRPFQATETRTPLNPGGMERRPAGYLELVGRSGRGYGVEIQALRGLAQHDGGVTQLYVGGKWVDIASFLDQPLVLSVTGAVHELPDQNAAILAQVPAGQPVGTVFSYVQNAQGFWWQLDRDLGQVGYVLFSPTATVTPPQPPIPSPTFAGIGLPDFSSFFSGLGTTGKWVVGGLAALAVITVARKL